MTDWTIAIVNYKTANYLKWQLKCFYEFNVPETFKIVIADNSCDPNELELLNKIASDYKSIYGNIKIFPYSPASKGASDQHGEALTHILKFHTATKYILFQDPDFFWVKKDVLAWLKSFLDIGHVAVGATYPNKVGFGNPKFPCAFGCAHKVDDIKHLDLYADSSDKARRANNILYPPQNGWEYSFDVGWKLRKELSSPSNSDNLVYFPDEIAPEVSQSIGKHSFQILTRKYKHNGEIVAYHLFRGSFTGKVTKDHADPKQLTPQNWLEARDRFSELFYCLLR